MSNLGYLGNGFRNSGLKYDMFLAAMLATLLIPIGFAYKFSHAPEREGRPAQEQAAVCQPAESARMLKFAHPYPLPFSISEELHFSEGRETPRRIEFFQEGMDRPSMELESTNDNGIFDFRKVRSGYHCAGCHQSQPKELYCDAEKPKSGRVYL